MTSHIETLWRATDVLRGWPAAAMAHVAAHTQCDDISPGERVLPAGESPDGLVAVLHGSVQYADTVLHTGNVMAPRHGVTRTPLPHSVHAGPHGAVLCRLPWNTLDTFLLEHPNLRNDLLLNIETPSLGTHHAAAAPPPQAGPQVAISIPTAANANRIWRDRLGAFAALSQAHRTTLAVTSWLAAALSVTPALFAKFLVDRVMVAHISAWWAHVAAAAAVATVLQVLTRNAAHYILFAYCVDAPRQTETTTARACAMLLQNLSVWVFPVVASCISTPLAVVLGLTALAHGLLIYRNAPWEAALESTCPINQPPADNGVLATLLAAEAIVRDGAGRRVAAHYANDALQPLSAMQQQALQQLQRSHTLSRYAAAAGQAALVALGMFQIQNHALSLGQWVAVVILARQQNQLLRGLLFRAGQLPSAVHVKAPSSKQAEAPAAVEPWDGSLQASGVSCGYSGDTPPALRDITLHLRPGTRLGVVGSSGSGKSTLARLLAGTLPARQGSMLAAPTWQHHTATVQYDSPLVAGRLAQVLAPTPYHPTALVVHALAMACALDVVDALPAGIETSLDFNDPRLSHSARLRLLVAQMLLLQPQLLVLDGVLDVMTRPLGHALLTNVRRELPHTSMVLISRHGDLLRRCDSIVVLQGGTIAQQGDFAAVSHTASFAGWVEHA